MKKLESMLFCWTTKRASLVSVWTQICHPNQPIGSQLLWSWIPENPSLLFKIVLSRRPQHPPISNTPLPPDNLNLKTGFGLLLPPQSEFKPGPSEAWFLLAPRFSEKKSKKGMSRERRIRILNYLCGLGCSNTQRSGFFLLFSKQPTQSTQSYRGLNHHLQWDDHLSDLSLVGISQSWCWQLGKRCAQVSMCGSTNVCRTESTFVVTTP